MIKRTVIHGGFWLTIVLVLVFGQHQLRAADDRWRIRGSLSEACTCSVPCTCNFGQGPSPHSYCWAIYSYEIREGQFNGIKLDGLKFGGMETAKGNAMYLDASARPDQRKALEAVARKVMRVSGDQMGHKNLLGMRWLQITQQYDERHDMVDLGGLGAFKTNYIMGRDKTKPVVVVNNTEWAIKEAIKGKTEYLRVKDEYGNDFSVTDSNSNHGDFEYTDKAHPGEGWPAGSSCSVNSKEDGKKHKH
jgi:hypothetical protein